MNGPVNFSKNIPISKITHEHCRHLVVGGFFGVGIFFFFNMGFIMFYSSSLSTIK